jgi:hypothetical protein
MKSDPGATPMNMHLAALVSLGIALVSQAAQASELGDLWWPPTKIQYVTQKPIPKGTVIKLRIKTIGEKATLAVTEYLGGAVEARELAQWNYDDITEVITFTVPRTMRVGVLLRAGKRYLPPGGSGDNGRLPDPYLSWAFGTGAAENWWIIEMKMERPRF